MSTMFADVTQVIADADAPLPSERARIVVVDDHRTFAELLSRALDAESDLECVGHAHDAKDAFTEVARLKPDVVLMDVRLPDRDGISTTAELITTYPALKVLILTAYASVADIQRAATAGASGFLAKDGSLSDVLDALRTVRSGSLILPEGLTARLSALGTRDEAMRQWRLTPRELEVLRLLGLGHDPRAIAKELNVSLHTCRDHVKRVLSKLGVHSQLEAVVVAMRTGLIRLDE